MTCDGCARDVSASLSKVSGITKVDANAKDQLVTVEGTGTRGWPMGYRYMCPSR